MKTIDKYILKKFLSSYIFVVLIIVAIICIIDLTEKNDNFLRNNLGLKDILGYYADFIPYIASFISPITVFIAVIFITARMAGHTEIIAILASGVSFRRFMVPYFIGAIIIAMANFYLGGWVIPDSNKSRVEFEKKYVKKPFVYDERNIHRKVAPDSYFYLQSYNNNSNIGYRFTLETIVDGKLLNKLSGQNIQWDPELEKWKVKNWVYREFEELGEKVTKGTELDTVISITPKDFENAYRLNETLRMDELNEYIDLLKMRGADDVKLFEIEKYIRYMTPFAAIILTFIGLIVSSRKTRGGAGFQIAFGFLLAFVYILFFTLSRSVALAGAINPILLFGFPISFLVP